MNYWTICDAFLLTTNIFHLSIALSFLHPVESPFKKLLTQIVSRASRFQSELSSSVVIILLVGIVATSGYQCYFHETSDSIMLVRCVVGIYTLVSAAVCMKLTISMKKLGVDRILEYEHELETHDILAFKPPPVALFNTLLGPQNALVRPDVTGIDNVPTDKPSLFVMNHSLAGVEMGQFIQTLYREKGVYVRGLADHIHYATPNGALLRKLGAVDGTRANVDTLMESGQNILVYPGGGHEVLKHSSVPKYALMWKERLGFARMAIKHGYQIVPCACVGVEDMLDIVADIPTGYKKLTIPVVKTSPCRLQKVYFWFGEPISTAEYKGDSENTDFAKEVRDKAKTAIENAIEEMRRKQENDPERFLSQQVKKAVISSVSTYSDTPILTKSNSDIVKKAISSVSSYSDAPILTKSNSDISDDSGDKKND